MGTHRSWPRLAVTVALVAAAPPLSAQEIISIRPVVNESTVVGTVYEHETGMPMSGASVSLELRTSGTEGVGGTFLSNAEGHFYFRQVPPGAYALVVESVGYQTLHDSVQVQPDSDHRLTLQLSPRPVALEPIVVVARRHRSLFMEGFEERRRRAHGGTFIDREEIEARNAHRVSDLLMALPGVQMFPLTRGGHGIFLRGCRPDVWVNGARTVDSQDAASGIDQFLPSADIEAVEVYQGPSTVPFEFMPATCGAVVIWTRAAEPDPEPTSHPFWQRALTALGVFGVGLLIGT